MDVPSYTALRQEILDFVAGPARQWEREIERTGRVLPAWREELRERGYFRLTAPPEYGGYGIPFTRYLELLRIFSHMHGSLRVLVHVANGIWRCLARAASEEQRERFLKPAVAGRRWITFTLTEPNSGSGTDIRTVARRDGADYILDGEKWMIIFADIADHFLLFCRLAGSRGADGTLALLVPRDAPGLEIRPMAPAMGVRGTAHAHLVLRDCRVPSANRIGQEGEGLTVAFSGFLDPSRIAVGMTCVGLAQHALDLAVRHAGQRVTFGKSLADRQAVQMWIAEMATDIEAARQLCLYAASAWETGRPAAALSAMAKLQATDMLQRVTDQALQIHGGIGYFQDREIERIYRDARMQRFEEGTAETQKMTIARALLADSRQGLQA